MTLSADDYIIQRAMRWRYTELALIAGEPNKETARATHKEARQDLREAVDLKIRKSSGKFDENHLSTDTASHEQKQQF